MTQFLNRLDYQKPTDRFWWALLDVAASMLLNKDVRFCGIKFAMDDQNINGRPVEFQSQVFHLDSKRSTPAAKIKIL